MLPLLFLFRELSVGDLSQNNLAGVIRELYVNRNSGILHLSQEDIDKRIYFKKGSMIFANSDVDEDRLGEFLIRSGKIDRNTFEMTQKATQDTGKRFGKTLVEMGHMNADEMQVLVVDQIEAIIYSLFVWRSGKYRFEQHESPVDEDIVLNLSTADIILEGNRRTKDYGAIRRALGDPHRILRHSENPLLLYQKISLTPSEGFMLSRMDSTTSVADIVAISPLGEEETLRCIYGLTLAGVLELGRESQPPIITTATEERVEIPKPEAAPLDRTAKAEPKEQGPTAEELAVRDDIVKKHAALATANYYELLGISANSGDAEVKKAYYAMAKKYHPDRHHSPHLQEVHGLLEELFVKITHAYHALSKPLDRRRYDSSLRTESPRGEVTPRSHTTPATPKKPAAASATLKTAEIRYREGKRYFDEMKYFDAIQCFREAVRLNPSEGRYHKRLALALAKNPHWMKEAEEQFIIALKSDEFDTESLLGLGEIYEASGMSTRAQKMYQRAYDYDSNNKAVREKLFGKKRGAMDGLKDILRRKKE